jgi:hypothetical protein
MSACNGQRQTWGVAEKQETGPQEKKIETFQHVVNALK